MATEPLYFEQYLSLKRTHPCKFYTLPTQRRMYLDQQFLGDSFFYSYSAKDMEV